MNTKVLVIGSGGNGQSYFIDFLKKNGIETNCNSDIDGLKHPSHPNKLATNLNIKKCIFIYNDPLKSILSHFRRGWQEKQMNKLGNPFLLKKDSVADVKKFLRIVSAKGRDMFGIEYQFNNWINTKTEYPILFIEFNNVIKERDTIDAFMGTHLDYSLFTVKERNSEDILESLKKTNRDLYMSVHKIYSRLFVDIRQKANEKNQRFQYKSSPIQLDEK